MKEKAYLKGSTSVNGVFLMAAALHSDVETTNLPSRTSPGSPGLDKMSPNRKPETYLATYLLIP